MKDIKAQIYREMLETIAIVCTGDVDKYLDCSKKKDIWKDDAFVEEIAKPMFYWTIRGKDLIQQDYKSWRSEFDENNSDDK